MLVMMKHPLHGRLPVYTTSEVETNKLNGWVIDEDAEENKKPSPGEKIAADFDRVFSPAKPAAQQDDEDSEV